ncbi:hydantoinase/oxoprolinase family protein [Rhizobium sp. C1]|uniref:hydantoinase/oxoprolinase family protein n=1 Tax=Rhizobium sp. C1 TaxID=1349799 RepID=UPI001E3E2BC1|nr:hydantoinase/oxoprolinase family protein [Rhizobium sp. C1]MCD2178555.1 hydantoinase/oxoprolinase family protein [Rhizobium sp. C1]
MADIISLGIDTGGTYTDAVIFSDTRGVLAKAKALTTRHDLSEGIAGAADAALAAAQIDSREIRLVSLSTTLATNALVEGQGQRVALVMIGFGEDDLARDGLGEAAKAGPVIFLPGGHDVHGRETPLEMDTLQEALPQLAGEVSAFAVAGYFAVRNPAHEQRVRDLILRETGLPVTCSHELSSKLGGPRRALTTLLNARLVGMIGRLVGACETYLESRNIAAPLMVVRGDGALISASEARLRPIETILSGPAASLAGAQFLTGLDSAVVSDIGGTTTDVAILEDGRPKLDPDGAMVGGHRTMVEAVAMRTYGLGGDSEVRIDLAGLIARIELGPRRVLPLSLIGHRFPDIVMPALEKQVGAVHAQRHEGLFAIRTGLPHSMAAGLSAQEAALYARITDQPQPLTQLLTTAPQKSALDRLAARGLAHICGITPSDALHILGRQGQWNAPAARLGLDLAARQKGGNGKPIAADAEDLANCIVQRLTRQSSHAILEACLTDDGETGIEPAKSRAIARALDRQPGVVRFSLALDRPLIGLGASAPVYYPAIAEELSAPTVIPDHADVANAIGAVAGQIRETVTVFVTSPEEGIFLLNGSGETLRFVSETEALEAARARAAEHARSLAARSGLAEPHVELTEEADAAEIEGKRKLVEARVRAVASGRPRVAD